MLIVTPNSSCDVCMENYMDGAGIPHAITCGHIFCRACLDCIQPQCPLCRDPFSPKDIRKLRVDSDVAVSSSTTSVTAPQVVDTHLQRLLEAIANTACGSASIEEMERVVDQCRVYHDVESDSPHTPLGVTCLLLSALLEARKKLCLQADQLSELAAARNAVRDRLTSELDAAQAKYQSLEQAHLKEKEAALRNEVAWRVRYNKMKVLWKSKVEFAREKYDVVVDELEQMQSPATQTATHSKATTVGDTTIPRRKVATSDSSGVATKLDKVKPTAFRLKPYIILVFKVIVASVGCVLFLLVSTVILQMGGK